jgi:hypothetical protein
MNLLGSMLLPFPLSTNFRFATRGRFARWSLLGAVMIVSHITASFQFNVPFPLPPFSRSAPLPFPEEPLPEEEVVFEGHTAET